MSVDTRSDRWQRHWSDKDLPRQPRINQEDGRKVLTPTEFRRKGLSILEYVASSLELLEWNLGSFWKDKYVPAGVPHLCCSLEVSLVGNG